MIDTGQSDNRTEAINTNKEQKLILQKVTNTLTKQILL